MAKNYSGRDYLLYVNAGSAPGSTDTPGGYNLVGKLVSVSVETSRNAIETSSKDDGDNSSFISGRRNSTINGSAIYDHTGVDVGQAELVTARDAADGLIYFLITSATSGDQEYHGGGVLTNLSYGFDDEAVSTIDFSIQVTGALTEADGGTT